MKKINKINEVKLSFKSYSSNESFSRIAAAAFFASVDPTVAQITDIKTAISEAVTNAIVHGYKDTVGTVYITLRILDNDTAYIKVRDNGCGIENIKKAMEPLYTTAPEDERAGLGFAVMQSFTDSVKVYSKVGKGTTVVMLKKLSKRDVNG